MITQTEMQQILLAFGKVFRQEVDGELVKLYYSVLSHVDVELFKIAAKEVIANETFFPKPAQLKDMINKLACKQAGLVSAEEAWAEVQSRLGGGRDHTPEFSNELILKSVNAIGGWRNLSNYPLDDFKTIRPQFMKMYNSYLTRTKEDFALLPETNDYIKKLTGQISSKFRLNR